MRGRALPCFVGHVGQLWGSHAENPQKTAVSVGQTVGQLWGTVGQGRGAGVGHFRFRFHILHLCTVDLGMPSSRAI